MRRDLDFSPLHLCSLLCDYCSYLSSVLGLRPSIVFSLESCLHEYGQMEMKRRNRLVAYPNSQLRINPTL